MNKKLMAILVIMGMVVSTSGGMAYAAAEQNEKECKWAKQEQFFKDLNLTPEQKEKVKAQKEAQKAIRKQSREQMKSKMEALHTELGKPATDRAVVNGLVADINTLKGQSFAQRIDGVLALKDILTPEQFSKFQAKHKEHGFGKHGGWKKTSESSKTEGGPSEEAPDPEEN